MPRVLLLAGLLVMFTAPAVADEATKFQIGFTDAAGTRAIVIGSTRATHPQHAICRAGMAIDARFVSHQAAAATGNPTRQVAHEFDKLEGDIYQLATAAEANQTCVVTNEVQRRVMLARPKTNCSASIRSLLVKARQRKVTQCVALATVDKDRELVTAVFAPNGNHALAALAYRDETRITLREYAADCKRGAPSCWRADDDGKWSPESFAVLAIFGTNEKPILAITWGGPEGENAMLLDASPSTRKMPEPTQTTYRYWSPE